MSVSLQQRLQSDLVSQESKAPVEGLADSLIRVNGLSYRMPSNMSVVVARTMKRSFSNLDTYAQNGKIIITWNSGVEYINAMNSYLVFKASVDAGVCNFGSGSAINFIDNVTVNSIQGTEVDRVEGVNNYRRDRDRYEYSQDWINNVGSVIGYGSTEDNAFSIAGAPDPIVFQVGQTTPVQVTTTPKVFCIPLSKLCGLCNTSVLLPSMLAGETRFEIKLASVAQALKKVSGSPTNYSLTEVSMHLDSYRLSDSIQKRLMQEAATSGLEFFYETYDRTRHNIPNSDKANITVRKAVSRALGAFAKTRQTNLVENIDFDSMASEANKVKDYFWRLGSLNFPNQPLRNKEEQYLYAQYAYGKLMHPHQNNSVSLKDFLAEEGTIAVTLERSSTLSLAGLPVNNSRTLQLEINYDDANANGRDIDVYMHYLQLARVFVNNILVKE